MALSLCRTTVDDSARELMEHGTAAFPIACYHDDLQAEPVPWHWHEELEVLVVSEGMIFAADTADGGCSIPFYSEDTPVGARIH